MKAPTSGFIKVILYVLGDDSVSSLMISNFTVPPGGRTGENNPRRSHVEVVQVHRALGDLRQCSAPTCLLGHMSSDSPALSGPWEALPAFQQRTALWPLATFLRPHVLPHADLASVGITPREEEPPSPLCSPGAGDRLGARC